MRTLLLFLTMPMLALADDVNWSFDERLRTVEAKVEDALRRIERVEGRAPQRVLIDGKWFNRMADGSIRECAECNTPATAIVLPQSNPPVVYVPATTIQTPLGTVPVRKVTVRRGLLGFVRSITYE